MASAQLAKGADDWAAWITLLAAAARTVQARSDSGDELAAAIVSASAWAAAGEGSTDDAGGAGSAVRLATAMIDSAAKSESRLQVLKKKVGSRWIMDPGGFKGGSGVRGAS